MLHFRSKHTNNKRTVMIKGNKNLYFIQHLQVVTQTSIYAAACRWLLCYYYFDRWSSIYGAHKQKQQSHATSYIPTAGTTITRAAETCNNSKPSVNSTEGVLYAEIAALSDDGTSRVISLSDSSDTNRVHLFYNVSTNTINVNYRVAGSSKAVMSFAVSDVTIMQKIAYKWKSGNFELFVNGINRGTSSNTTMMPANTMNQLAFNVGGSGLNFYGKVKGLAVYNEALSESQLMQLTGVTASSIYSNFVTRTASFTVEALNEVKKVIDNL